MLAAMTIPRTFIRGERGERLLDEVGLEAAGVKVVTIPDAGHMMMRDNPAAFIAALAEGLAARG
jgi:pimeloyl-ACP methyl ester carboxylesterase